MEALSSKYINVNGSLLDLSVPCVMGILNITPDSFYVGSRMQTEAEIAARAQPKCGMKGADSFWVTASGLRLTCCREVTSR